MSYMDRYLIVRYFEEDNSKGWTYLTDDESIEIGDFVRVPVGQDNHLTVAKVIGERTEPLQFECKPIIDKIWLSPRRYK